MQVIEKFKNHLLNILPENAFIRHVATMITGTAVASALNIIAIPLLTRLYKPEDFGLFALYTSLLGLLSVIVCMRYEVAIVIPEKDEDAANLLMLCIIVTCVISALTLLLIYFLRTPFASLLGSPALSPWLFFLPLSLVTFGLFRILNYWSTRRKNFKRLAVRQITQSSITAVSQTGLGAVCVAPNVSGLITGSILGQMVAAGRLAWQVKRDEGEFIKRSFKISRLVSLAKRYKYFPMFDLWSAFLNSASTLLPTLLLSYFFSPLIVGFYALGFKILVAPISFMGDSIAQVFFPHANEAKRNGQISQLTLNIFKRLLNIGLVPFMLFTIVAPDLFALVFGSAWYTAGVYARWMSAWFLFVFIASPLSHVYVIMEKQREGLIVNTVIFVSRLSALIIGGIKGNALYAIIIFGTTGAILWLFNCFYIQHLAGVSITKILFSLFQEALYGIPYALLPLLIYWITNNSMAFAISGVCAGFIFLIVQMRYVKRTS